MKNIVLTSCGIINEKFKEQFYGVINKEEVKNKKILMKNYIYYMMKMA